MQELNLTQTEEVAGGVLGIDDLVIFGAGLLAGMAIGYLAGKK